MKKKSFVIAMIICYALAAAVVAEAQETTVVKSQVLSVKAKDRTLTLRGAKSGERVEYYVSPEAKISRKGQSADLRMLRPGDIVTITVNSSLRDNEFSLATVVAVKAPEPAVGRPEPQPEVVAVTPPRTQAAPTRATVAAAPRTELPKTAGWLPLAGLIGAGLLAISGALARRPRI